MRRTGFVLIALFALLIPLASCGGDDEEGGGASVEAYCEFSVGLDEQDSFPTDEQLDELVELAPDEISDDVERAVEQLKESNENPEEAAAAFEEPDMVEAIGNIEAFEQEECGREAEE